MSLASAETCFCLQHFFFHPFFENFNETFRNSSLICIVTFLVSYIILGKTAQYDEKITAKLIFPIGGSAVNYDYYSLSEFQSTYFVGLFSFEKQHTAYTVHIYLHIWLWSFDKIILFKNLKHTFAIQDFIFKLKL